MVQALPSSVLIFVCVIAPVEVLQASVVQTEPSLIFTGVWNTPVAGIQPSVVHAFPSSVFTDMCVTNPEEVLQASVVQRLLSLIFTGVWEIPPVIVLHASIVHAFPSLGFIGKWKTPNVGSQTSCVQPLPSLELIGL